MISSHATTVTMQDAATAIGNGTYASVADRAFLVMQVAGTFVGTITFEATVDESNWIAVQASNLNNGAIATSTTEAGLYATPAAGLTRIRARVSAYTSGSITVIGHAVALSPGLSLADIDGTVDVRNDQIGSASAENSTTTPLAGGGTFTGTAVDTKDFVTLNVAGIASHASATDGLCIDWSPDGTNWDLSECHTIAAATGFAHLSRCKARYVRVRYTNGATPQTYFRLAAILKRNAVSMTYEQLSADIDDDHDAALVRSVLAAKKPSGDYTNIEATTGGNLKVSVEEFDTALPAGSNNIGIVNSADIPTTPTEYNVTLTSANTEYSQALPATCRAVAFRCRNSADVRYAWTTGKVAGPTAPYQTLAANAEYFKENIEAASKTLYFASATAGVVVEIEAWS